MKAPVSWIRDHVDLPADVSTSALTDKLTALGLKLEALERPGHDIAGPLVVGQLRDVTGGWHWPVAFLALCIAVLAWGAWASSRPRVLEDSW